MLVLGDVRTLLHRTVELLNGKSIPAYESPERILSIIQALAADGTHEYVDVGAHLRGNGSLNNSNAGQASTFVAETHDPGYLHYLQSVHKEWVSLGLINQDEVVLPECFRLPSMALKGREPSEPRDPSARSGYYSFDMSAGLSTHSWTSIMASAELAAEAVRSLFISTTSALPRKNVLALCRPPGHHCTTRMAGGYCYLNNAVVAVQALRHFHRQSTGDTQPKVVILDIDFHHGNGTQDYFYHDPSVVYVSIHGEDQYPYYTGDPEEEGAGDGEGTNWNIPLPLGASADEYIDKLSDVMQILEDAQPGYLILSLGFDTYHGDPLGYFGIRTEDYERIARVIRGHPAVENVPAVLLLEGGYVVEDLGQNMLSFLRGWEGLGEPQPVWDPMQT